MPCTSNILAYTTCSTCPTSQIFWRALLVQRAQRVKILGVPYVPYVAYMPYVQKFWRALRVIRAEKFYVSYTPNKQKVYSCGEENDAK